MNKEQKLQSLISFFMSNPDLGESIDYKENKTRLAYYTKELGGLNESDLDELLEEYQ